MFIRRADVDPTVSVFHFCSVRPHRGLNSPRSFHAVRPHAVESVIRYRSCRADRRFNRSGRFRVGAGYVRVLFISVNGVRRPTAPGESGRDCYLVFVPLLLAANEL